MINIETNVDIFVDAGYICEVFYHCPSQCLRSCVSCHIICCYTCYRGNSSRYTAVRDETLFLKTDITFPPYHNLENNLHFIDNLGITPCMDMNTDFMLLYFFLRRGDGVSA